ncbi:hypothetical protein [Desulfoscipio gibsoniae]|uniref:Uncharacterized protein n=1 Tax=Desulfoscipio gibsoniae DSM 7213 TaxID=767817 RepID=R4KAR0_9FIRM|nr:hypothetical protein [Desulfoscipio gibsoniae]AGK99648.1 hypothetical protein Desgi_0028 [Desulfoscipio gibsoniae DSM 7213]
MKYIRIQMPKHILVLTDQELERLLARDPKLWKLAIGRGKGLRRYQAAKARANKDRG